MKFLVQQQMGSYKQFAIRLIFVIFGTLLGGGYLAAQVNESKSDITVGFADKIKLGSWSPIFVDIESGDSVTKFEVIATDGNGIPVRYTGSPTRVPGGLQAWFRVGRSEGEVSLRLFDASNKELLSRTITLGKDAHVLDPTVPMCLTIEKSELIADEIRSCQTQLFGERCEVVAINNSRLLPTIARAYRSIQIIYLATSDAALIESITEQQWEALKSWVTSGGKLVFSAGINAKQLLADSRPLSRFLPGIYEEELLIKKSSQFEQFTQSRRGQLLNRGDPPIVGAKVSKTKGIVELSIGEQPIVIRQPHGFGQIVFSATDIDVKPFSEWIGRKNYLMRLTFGQLNLNRVLKESDDRRFVQYGATDIMGQLVFPLEKFSQVRFISFTVVALLIGFLILCIGPGDFYLLKRLFRSMEWTWLTFTVLTLLFCGLAIFLFGATRPKKIQINQLEIIDIDTIGDSVRGNIWTNVYSPTNTKCSVSLDGENLLDLDVNSSVVSWMGIPEKGLGGMRSQTAVGLYQQAYENNFQSESRSILAQLPIKVSSTKPIHTEYTTQKSINLKSRLRLNPNTNQLQGTITNPFDFEIRDCRVVFENWAYILGAPLGAGETVDVFSEMKERTATSYFSRRVNTEDSKGGDVPWDPEEDNIDRIAEVIMFHQAAGGKSYTKLTHGFQPWLDMTEHLNLRRAVLFGKAEDVCTRLNIESDAGDCDFDQSRTYLRLVLPVEYRKR